MSSPGTKKKVILFLSTLVALLTAGAVQAQVDNKDIDDEDIYELSPFIVDSSQDQGYTATSTLAGTRIKTSLKDIGTSVQVVTKDFLNDIGADDNETLLNYTTNTEIGGAQGNYSGNDASDSNVSTQESRGNPHSTSRVRGLFRADLTRNYFKSLIPWDSYNTSSVDINRGSNATLFGLGSPAGIINNTLDAPYFGNGGEFQIRIDDFGSFRSSLNYNYELVEKKLAVRAAAVTDKRKYYQNPTYQDRDRYYVASTWKITPTTKLRVNYERGYTKANRPDSTSPIEAVTPWLLMDKRILDSGIGTGIGYQGTPTGIKVDKDGDGILDDVYSNEIYANRIYDYMQYGDGTFVNQGNWEWNAENQHITAPSVPSIPGAERGTTGGIGQPQIWGQGAIVYSDPTSSEASHGFKAQYAGNENYAGDALSLMGDGEDPLARFVGINNINGFFNNWKSQGYTNLKGFNWGKNLIGGTTAEQTDEFDAYNITLEQTFWDQKVGFELAYDKQRFDYDYFTPLQVGNVGQLKVDMNVRLPDGSVNPNLGRPYMISRNYRMNRHSDMETLRATGYIQHDFAEQFDKGWLKWLGRHTITGLYDKNKDTREEFRLWQVWDDVDVRRVLRVADDANDLNNFSSRVFPFVYVGPSLLSYDVNSVEDVIITPPDGLKLWDPGRSVPFTYWDPGSSAPGVAARDEATVVANGQMVTRNVPITAAATEKVQFTETVTDSIAFVHQGYFLKDHIVSTIGYRKDTVESKIYSQPPNDEYHRNQLDAPLSEWNEQIDNAEEDRWSYGVVAHIPEKWTPWQNTQFSIHASKSSNFSLEAGRVNWNNEPIGNPGGSTEEWGFAVNTLEGKLHARINWFETSLTGRTSSGVASLLWNSTLGRINGYLSAADGCEDPLYADFNRAAAMTIWDNVSEGEKQVFPARFVYNDAGESIGLDFDAVKAYKDTEDVVAKGMELEITYNPIKNWRIHANIAKVETVLSNVHPNTISQWKLREQLLSTPVKGYEWITMGELSTAGKNEGGWIIDPLTQTYADLNDPTNTDFWTLNDDFEGKMVSYWTKKAAEGSLATEQRKWRFNLITNYSFTEKLKGLSIGGAYRWQDEVAVGFPLITNDEGKTVGDVDNPVYASAQDNVDVFASYKMPYLKKYGDWSVRLQVRNVFAGEDDLIPVQLQGDGVSFSRYRLAPQREIIFTSTFKF